MATTRIPNEGTSTKTDAVLAAIGATLLIVTEMLGAAFAFAWALAGLFGFGDTATYILLGLVAIPGVIASLALTRRVLRVEATLRALPQG